MNIIDDKTKTPRKKILGNFMSSTIGVFLARCKKVFFSSLVLGVLLSSCDPIPAFSETINLKASWYSIESLKKEGTYKHSKGVMANGKLFSDTNFTCANRLFPLGTILKITNTRNNKSVVVRTTDRIGKRFAKTRIDLSKAAFLQIADLKQGLIPIQVKVLK